MDQKGYVMTPTSYLLIIPAIMLSISLINFVHGENELNSNSIESDKVAYAFEDVKRNIPIISREIFKNTSLEIIENNKTVSNSHQTIKESIQYNINCLTENYENKTGLKIHCTINSVQSYHFDPEYIEVNSTLSIEQNNVIHSDSQSQLVSIKGLPDPLPFIKCRPYGTIKHNNSQIIYGNSLKAYLDSKNIENSSYYINATSPLILKKCPYDPYISHDSLKTLQNCIFNGFYHESADGSCYMCRLEGKGTCTHYGLETFILPSPFTSNITALNISTIKAPCSSDHVIFGSDNYPGLNFTYNTENQISYVLFLDNGHKTKYGLI